RDRQQEQRAVDDPVAPRAASRRLLVLLREDQGRQETASGHAAKRRCLGRPWTPFRRRSEHRLWSVQESPYGRLPRLASQPIVSSMAAIEIQGLSKRFGEVAAVDDLSFTVRAGTVTGFLGPNGAGKSTTLRMLLGLVRPSQGSATIGGKRYAELAEPFRRVG